MENIDFQHRTRLVFGPDRIEQLGELTKEQGALRALVVSDEGVVGAGHYSRGVRALESAGVTVEAFHGVCENPTTAEVEAGLQVAKQFQPEVIIGLGGGSSMDCAKGINFLYSCGGKMEDYWGVGKAPSEMLPMIAVPTTAGTGSEAQSFALISQAETHVKMACGDKKAACRVAILDPTLTLTQPPQVTALTGIDAVSHAIESYVTKKRNPLSICYSRQAWQLLGAGLPRVLASPADLDSRGQMQLGAFFAGLAIETSMLGAAHALANPLTARFGTTHGQAVGLMLPHVITFNGEHYDTWYSELWHEVSRNAEAAKFECGIASLSLAKFITHLVAACGLHTSLEHLQVPEGSLAQLAEDATKQWTGTFNPREMTVDDFQQLYRNAMKTSKSIEQVVER